MQSLEKRHEDRARRIVVNGTEVGRNTAASVGAAAALFRDFATVAARLNSDEQAELRETIGSIEDEIRNNGFSLAEAPDGSGRTMAGVGVINTKVVPAGVEAPEAGNGGGTTVDAVDGWGANASPAGFTENREGSNLGGEALQEQGAGSDLKASAKAAETPADPAPAPAPAPSKSK